jgi:hypothetical protein
MAPRRFPPPWSVEELDACYVVRDHSGQQLAYVYFEDEPGWRFTGPFANTDLTQSRGGGTKSLRCRRWLLSRRFCGRCKDDRLHCDKIVDLAPVYPPGFNYE